MVVKALMSLCNCVGSHEPWLLKNRISSKILCVGLYGSPVLPIKMVLSCVEGHVVSAPSIVSVCIFVPS